MRRVVIALIDPQRQEYNHFDEIHDQWPVNMFSPMFTSPMPLNTCPERCPMSFAPRIMDSYNVHSTLPACPLDQPVGGIWLPQSPIDVAYPPTAALIPRQGIDPLYPFYEFVPETCRYIHAGRQFSPDHVDCVARPFKVLFAGDSHVRYAMLHFIYRLDGHTDYYPENDSGVSWTVACGNAH